MATNADLYAVHRYQRATVLARCTGTNEQLPEIVDLPVDVASATSRFIPGI